MGARTASNLISEALLEAGDTSLSTRALVWLNDWLRSQYAAWAWPFLKQRASGLSLSSGSTSLTVGAGSGGVTNGIHRIFAPITVYRADRTVAGMATIKQLTGNPDPSQDPDAVDPNTFKGVPTQFLYRQSSTDGQLILKPLPFPDRDLLLAFYYQERPANLAASDTPAYPNDRTSIQAIIQKALGYMHGPSSREAMNALEVLRGMVIEDRTKYGLIPGDGDEVQLDTSIYR